MQKECMGLSPVCLCQLLGYPCHRLQLFLFSLGTLLLDLAFLGMIIAKMEIQEPLSFLQNINILESYSITTQLTTLPLHEYWPKCLILQCLCLNMPQFCLTLDWYKLKSLNYYDRGPKK